jgi:hypothetical protein
MKKSLISSLALVLTGILLAESNASATSFITSTAYGGHTYELWADLDISWAAAKANAEAGGGFLASLTDAAETSAVYGSLIGNNFFTGNDGQKYQAWLGGYTTKPNYSTTDPTAWAWVTGEAWSAFDAGNFASGEPNGDSSGLTINRFGTSKWNDESGRVGGYIVEKNGVERNGVPDSGSTLALLAGACAMIGTLGRRFRK